MRRETTETWVVVYFPPNSDIPVEMKFDNYAAARAAGSRMAATIDDQVMVYRKTLYESIGEVHDPKKDY